MQNAKKLHIHCYSYQTEKAILSYERCACFDSECLTAQSAESADRVRRWFFSCGSVSNHSSELFSLIYL